MWLFLHGESDIYYGDRLGFWNHVTSWGDYISTYPDGAGLFSLRKLGISDWNTE